MLFTPLQRLTTAVHELSELFLRDRWSCVLPRWQFNVNVSFSRFVGRNHNSLLRQCLKAPEARALAIRSVASDVGPGTLQVLESVRSLSRRDLSHDCTLTPPHLTPLRSRAQKNQRPRKGHTRLGEKMRRCQELDASRGAGPRARWCDGRRCVGRGAWRRDCQRRNRRGPWRDRRGPWQHRPSCQGGLAN